MALSPEPRRMNRLLLAGGIAAVVVLALWGIKHLTRERVRVRVALVTYQDLQYSVAANGKVELVSDYPAHAQNPGQVEEIYVDVGQKVKKGDLLIRMQDEEAVASMARAKTSLSAARAALSDMERGGSQDDRNSFSTELSRLQMQRSQDATDLASIQQLQQKGAAAPSEVAAVQRRLQADDELIRSNQLRGSKRYTEGDHARAQAQVAEAEATVAAAQTAYGNFDIRSPIEGTVYSIAVSQFDYVHGGDDLLNVADLTSVQVRAYFDEPDIARLMPGQPVKIVWEAKPAMAWHGHVERVPTTIVNYGTRNVGECIISVDDANGELAPNSDVTVTVTTQQHLHVLSIPREALHTEGAKNFVYRVVQDKLVRTAVGVSVVNLTRVEVTSGLSERDLVAVSASDNKELDNGLEIIPIPVQ
jgi:HlyD family secretion protein